MIVSYVVGVLTVVGLAVGWIAVQGAWRSAFSEGGELDDVLEGRTGCHACTSATACRESPVSETEEGVRP